MSYISRMTHKWSELRGVALHVTQRDVTIIIQASISRLNTQSVLWLNLFIAVWLCRFQSGLGRRTDAQDSRARDGACPHQCLHERFIHCSVCSTVYQPHARYTHGSGFYLLWMKFCCCSLGPTNSATRSIVRYYPARGPLAFELELHLFVLLWICRTTCTTCCATNPQKIEQSAVWTWARGNVHVLACCGILLNFHIHRSMIIAKNAGDVKLCASEIRI